MYAISHNEVRRFSTPTFKKGPDLRIGAFSVLTHKNAPALLLTARSVTDCLGVDMQYTSLPQFLTPATIDRFWSNVEKSDECWTWTGSRIADYGRFSTRGVSAAAHRVSYAIAKGDVPDGLVLDHLCRNHACVNPDHLEPVTNHENILRGMAAGFGPGRPVATVCAKAGHPFTEANTIKVPNGKRCRQCRNEYKRTKYAEQTAA